MKSEGLKLVFKPTHPDLYHDTT